MPKFLKKLPKVNLSNAISLISLTIKKFLHSLYDSQLGKSSTESNFQKNIDKCFNRRFEIISQNFCFITILNIFIIIKITFRFGARKGQRVQNFVQKSPIVRRLIICAYSNHWKLDWIYWSGYGIQCSDNWIFWPIFKCRIDHNTCSDKSKNDSY